MGEEKKFVKLMAVIEDSTALRGIILNKDVTHPKMKRRIIHLGQIVRKADNFRTRSTASTASPWSRAG